MSEIHFNTNQGNIRFYEAGKSHDQKSDFELIIHSYVVGDENIILSGALGKMTKSHALKLEKELNARGIKFIIAHLPTDKFKPIGFVPLSPTNLHILDVKKWGKHV